jgi:GDPmannose 4,6-dehydratase
MRSALITGVNGQDGSYLAEFLLARGYRVIGLVREDAGDRLDRIRHIRSQLDIVPGDLLDDALLRRVLEAHRPDEVYNFAARASSSQLLTDPTLTAEYNGLAVVRMLEAIRTVNPGIRLCQASSSEMFGSVAQSPQNELTPFRPRNPYGVAKLFAHGMVGTYRENFGVFGCSAILFNHESPRRGAEFVTRKISMSVARIRAGLARSLPLGDLDVTRDWGFAGDYVRAMWQMLQTENADDYVVATGISHSVREFCALAFDRVGLDYRAYVQTDPRARRARESIPFLGDAGKAQRELGWQPSISFEQLVNLMVDADIVAQQVA